jgi:hypothetical protein
MQRPINQVTRIQVLGIVGVETSQYRDKSAIFSPVHGMVYVAPMDPNAVPDALATGTPDARRFCYAYPASNVRMQPLADEETLDARETREVVVEEVREGETRDRKRPEGTGTREVVRPGTDTTREIGRWAQW